MEDEKIFKSRLVGEGVIVLLITAFAYMAAYLYEFGYVAYFQIPKSFISINIASLLVAAGSIGFMVFTSVHFLGFTLPMFRTSNDIEEKNIHYRRFMFLNASWIVAGIFLIKTYGISLVGISVYLLLVVFINVVMFGFRVLKPVKMSLKERVAKTSVGEDHDPFDIWSLLRDFLGYDAYKVLVVAILFLSLSFVVGNGEAHRQKDFLVTYVEGEPYILIRKYDDSFILLSISKDEKSFSSIMKIRGISSDEYTTFELVELGSLSKD